MTKKERLMNRCMSRIVEKVICLCEEEEKIIDEMAYTFAYFGGLESSKTKQEKAKKIAVSEGADILGYSFCELMDSLYSSDDYAEYLCNEMVLVYEQLIDWKKAAASLLPKAIRYAKKYMKDVRTLKS